MFVGAMIEVHVTSGRPARVSLRIETMVAAPLSSPPCRLFEASAGWWRPKFPGLPLLMRHRALVDAGFRGPYRDLRDRALRVSVEASGSCEAA